MRIRILFAILLMLGFSESLALSGDRPDARNAESKGQVFALEGVLRINPKYLYRYYLTEFGDQQMCALFGNDKLQDVKPGSRIHVEGRLGTRFHDGGRDGHPSPFPRTWFIFMDVETVRVLREPEVQPDGVTNPSQQPKTSPDPILVALQSQLERELRELKPAPAFEVPESSTGRSLVMRYKTREYLVYPSNKTGRLGTALVEREGPDDDGILLRIHLQPKEDVNQAVVPQTIREPYWSLFLNVYPIVGSDKNFYMALSFRGGTDKRLIERITKIVEHHEGTPQR